MWKIDHSYIDGAFVPVHGNETVACINPATEAVIGTVTLTDRDDARRAIAAAARAQVAMNRTSKAERIDMLKHLQTDVLARAVFADVSNAMDIAQEEIFGPVLSIIAYDSEEQMIDIANTTPYGLQAYVFSRQADRARSLASRLQAGSVLINRITPELLAPFGGVKQSGVGREFGVFGLEGLLEAKSIVLG